MCAALPQDEIQFQNPTHNFFHSLQRAPTCVRRVAWPASRCSRSRAAAWPRRTRGCRCVVSARPRVGGGEQHWLLCVHVQAIASRSLTSKQVPTRKRKLEARDAEHKDEEAPVKVKTEAPPRKRRREVCVDERPEEKAGVTVKTEAPTRKRRRKASGDAQPQPCKRRRISVVEKPDTPCVKATGVAEVRGGGCAHEHNSAAHLPRAESPRRGGEGGVARGGQAGAGGARRV